MNDKEFQKIIDTKNGTISVLKDTVKKWVREYNMLDACIELQNEKINAYKMSENEANEIIAELEAENTKQKEMIDRQWKLLEQCGVSGGGELKRVSYLFEKLREEKETLRRSLKELQYSNEQHLWQVIELDKQKHKTKTKTEEE